MNTLSKESSSLICHLMAILSEAREEHRATAAKLIAKKRLCCSFFLFGPLELRLTGGEGVKEFLQRPCLRTS